MGARLKPAEWTKQAELWSRLGSPLRPTAEDGALAIELTRPACNGDAVTSVAILGVTPELVQLPWPAGARITAIDCSARMIAAVWRPAPARCSAVVRARWQDMPLQASCVHVAVGDGSLNALESAGLYHSVLAEIARALKPSGRLVLRCFVRTEPTESLEHVRAAAMSGRISSFHALKWRLAMALPVNGDFHVAVKHVHAAFSDLFPDRERLAAAGNWSQDMIGTIDHYASLDSCYTFPTLAAVIRHASPWFTMQDVRYGSYELAERCPTVCFALRKSARGGAS